jgi:hypothetical protein
MDFAVALAVKSLKAKNLVMSWIMYRGFFNGIPREA